MRAPLGVAVSLLVAGCDPGWTYHVATDQMPTVQAAATLADSAHLSLELVQAWLFAGGLHIRVGIPNASTRGLTLDSASLQVLDRQGGPLPRTLVAAVPSDTQRRTCRRAVPGAISLSTRRPAFFALTQRFKNSRFAWRLRQGWGNTSR